MPPFPLPPHALAGSLLNVSWSFFGMQVTLLQSCACTEGSLRCSQLRQCKRETGILGTWSPCSSCLSTGRKVACSCRCSNCSDLAAAVPAWLVSSSCLVQKVVLLLGLFVNKFHFQSFFPKENEAEWVGTGHFITPFLSGRKGCVHHGLPFLRAPEDSLAPCLILRVTYTCIGQSWLSWPFHLVEKCFCWVFFFFIPTSAVPQHLPAGESCQTQAARVEHPLPLHQCHLMLCWAPPVPLLPEPLALLHCLFCWGLPALMFSFQLSYWVSVIPVFCSIASVLTVAGGLEVVHLRDLHTVMTSSAGTGFSRLTWKFPCQQTSFKLLLLSGCYSLTGKKKAASIKIKSFVTQFYCVMSRWNDLLQFARCVVFQHSHLRACCGCSHQQNWCGIECEQDDILLLQAERLQFATQFLKCDCW